ncbi:bifunctional UDP-N-acetylglucosamine diphosphorylase/glucosamine-1-phosphate N-acetyltransferase GlmU [Weissella koreensis]|uniref:Bifunctional protein GlmU n=1 Tax=Weissella koreensis TaxID=165096 RepID=A0A7H1ML81_9LACO|nr:bifunctional UDP-N-acetylglucosamine diphosphorylase/glucosamine-1-phosphate N-acetyltransferase GlmU [Weissella koreensis]AVH75013.1 bifunctional UDP-N-acetylglucosamine diphosphorylase/glucosamine-1-phosphate N-acetyltransferase GlmU [Weissella koreensis]QGN20239.1 bifunctional UDP-N-acetylglucosamine diphosphorylase/glucosamine-1-phosphate N-acetyltransferase GlmU [Weissella koreensis]QNT64217.1 bifunctional UDP-N-acetylglucosamine diphosphorylase/glucosamine-1-phosphate N-acetyltransferas
MGRYSIIMAAGKGTRMKSTLPKVLHKVGGKTMVDLVLDTILAVGVEKIVTVVGHEAEMVRAQVEDRSSVVVQTEQLGTGHAVKMAAPILAKQEGSTLIASGDAPLFTKATYENAFAYHEQSGNAVTVLTAKAANPFGYGRVIRADDGAVLRIVEQKDANEAEAGVDEINTGVYVFDNQLLFAALEQVTNDNAQGEYYLPDTLEILRKQDQVVGAYQIDDFNQSMGVNDRVALAQANQILRQRINTQHMKNGVTLIDPQTTYIDVDVQIGSDTVIENNVVLKGHTKIDSNVVLTAGTRIIDSEIKTASVIDNSTIEESVVGPEATVGPYAHLRPASEVGVRAHVGNFVEMKKAQLGTDSKAGHLTYIGDATIGSDVNIGAGTVFVNYDGQNKHHTTIGDRAFIGSNTKIIGPVEMKAETISAAGSTITDDIPEHAMGIARARQENKPDFWERLPVADKFKSLKK